jgi:hypothetical protein
MMVSGPPWRQWCACLLYFERHVSSLAVERIFTIEKARRESSVVVIFHTHDASFFHWIKTGFTCPHCNFNYFLASVHFSNLPFHRWLLKA